MMEKDQIFLVRKMSKLQFRSLRAKIASNDTSEERIENYIYAPFLSKSHKYLLKIVEKIKK